jgi:hypothetical protein
MRVSNNEPKGGVTPQSTADVGRSRRPSEKRKGFGWGEGWKPGVWRKLPVLVFVGREFGVVLLSWCRWDVGEEVLCFLMGNAAGQEGEGPTL